MSSTLYSPTLPPSKKHHSQPIVTPPDSCKETSSSPPALPNPQTDSPVVLKIIQHLRSRREGKVQSAAPWVVFSLSHGDFEFLIERIKEDDDLWAFFDDKVRYDYFWSWERFILRMPVSRAHELVIHDIIFELGTQLRAKNLISRFGDIKSLGSQTYRLPNDPEQESDGGYNIHCPDASFGLSSEKFPGLIIEVANTQKAKSLEQIADDYIVGSEGHIRVVVGLKFNYLNSRRATISIWRSTLTPADDGVMEHSCEQVIEEEAFRNDDGNHVTTSKGLILQLNDFSLATRNEPSNADNRLYISSLQLYSIVNAAERTTQQDVQQAQGTTLPQNIRHKKRQRTPTEEIKEKDERTWSKMEEREEKRMRRSDRAFAGRRKREDEGERRRTRSQGEG